MTSWPRLLVEVGPETVTSQAVEEVRAGREQLIALDSDGDLLGAAVAHATAIGLEQLLLSARGGTTLPEFYVEQGWAPVGLFPDALRMGPDDLRDEHWFQLRLNRPAGAASPAAPPRRGR